MVSTLSESTINVSIDGFVQEVVIDSGSVSNLMGEEDFFKLKGLGLKGKVEHCSKKISVKIDELLKEDIIERVEGPTTWASPVLVAPKPSGEIRLCVDMRPAKEAIVRERLPIPTVDEVLEQLNRSTVFSKLDLPWGFHQIELHEDSRDHYFYYP